MEKNGLLRGDILSSLQGDNSVFYYLSVSKIWPDKSDSLWWEKFNNSMPTGFFIWGYMYPFTFIFEGTSKLHLLALHLGVKRKWTAFCSFHMSSFCTCCWFFLSIWNKISICCFECIIWTVIFWCLKEIKALRFTDISYIIVRIGTVIVAVTVMFSVNSFVSIFGKEIIEGSLHSIIPSRSVGW